MTPSGFTTVNAAWRRDLFHAELARRLELEPGAMVVDVGCGGGWTLKPLLQRYGWVTGLDPDADALARAREMLPDGRLQLELIQPGAPLPLKTGEADGLILQNVLEYVDDTAALIAECRRILRRGGVMLAGHFDFDGVILASGFRDTTRRLLHAFSDAGLPGQPRADGQTGRELPGLMRGFDWARLELSTVPLVEYEPSPDGYAGRMIEWLADAAPAAGVSAEDLAAWRTDLDARAAEGRFHFVLPWMIARGTCPT